MTAFRTCPDSKVNLNGRYRKPEDLRLLDNDDEGEDNDDGDEDDDDKDEDNEDDFDRRR